jgi:transcriptional regulator with XRE-family HTH domain
MLATPKLLGARMKHLREQAHLSADNAARLARVNRGHIYALERGAWWPSMDTLQELARIYRVDTADFFAFPDRFLRDREKYLRDGAREFLRLVPNNRLAAVMAAMEQAGGATLDELLEQAASAPDAADAAKQKAQ